MRTVLIDTNLLILYLAGSINPACIQGAKRLTTYDSETFSVLIDLLGKFLSHVSIPNILSETSNLINAGSAGNQEIVPGITSVFSLYCQKLREVYEPSLSVTELSAFGVFGLTDAAIVKTSLRGDFGREGVTILTDDAPLYAYLSKVGARAENLSHYRTPG